MYRLHLLWLLVPLALFFLPFPYVIYAFRPLSERVEVMALALLCSTLVLIFYITCTYLLALDFMNFLIRWDIHRKRYETV